MRVAVSEALTDIEALLWSLEGHDPLLRASITVVVMLDGSPGVEHLRGRAELATVHIPRLRHRIVAGATRLSRPRWLAEEAIDASWHVRVVACPEGHEQALAGVLRLIEPMAAEALDRARPPWQMTLVEHIDAAGAAALVIRLHHVCADGVGALGLASMLFDLSPSAPPSSAGPGGHQQSPPAALLDDGLLAEAATTLGRSLATARARLPLLAAHAREALVDPEPRAQATVDLMRSVARLASPSALPLSPVMTGRSIASRLGVIDVDLERAREAGRAAGGTVNDVFVAGLLDGLRRYHDVHGHRPAALRIGVPINLRTGVTEDVSNAFAPARITAPLQIDDAGARIAAVHRLVLSERHQPAHDVIGPLAGVVQRLPGGRLALGAALGSVDAMASNVPGPPVPLWLGPARVKAIYPFGPRSGSGLNVTLLSLDGTAHIGVHVDPVATPDSGTLLSCLRDGLEATLGGDS